MPGHIEAFDPVPEMGIASVAPPPERSVAPPPERMRDERAIERERDFQNFLSNTGRSDKDPYGDQGIFSGLAKKMGFTLDYTNNMTPAQINAVNRKAYQRFSNFGSIDPIAQGRRFGRPFGSSVGEMTAEGPVRKLVPTAPMSGAEMGARLGFAALGSLGPIAALENRRGTKFAPLGSVEYAQATDSGEFFDPIANPELQRGIFSQVLDLGTGGAGSAVLEAAGQGVSGLLDTQQESESDGATTMSSLPSFGREALEQRGVANTVEEGVVPVVSDGVKAVSAETGNTVTVIDDSSNMNMFAERRNRVPNMIDTIRKDFVDSNVQVNRVADVFSPMTEPSSLEMIQAMNEQVQSSIEDQNEINRKIQFQQDLINEARRASGITTDPNISGFGQSQLASGILQNTTNTASSVTPPVPLSSYFGRITEDSFSNFGPNK